MTKEEKGILAVLRVQERALTKGWLVSAPTNPCRYDLVLDDGKRLYRAQVKYANSPSPHSQGAYRLDLKKRGRTYSRAEVDVVIAYLPNGDKICWFEPEVFDGKKTLYIRVAPTKNGQRSKCILADDHRW